jgi:hypothetical protein
MAESPPIVLLIHGTFAAAEADDGAAWWQRGSETWTGLSELLPDNARLCGEQPLFHWSGANTEWEREKAAERILEQLLQFEAADQPYHLIGHSHGGSAIWSALKGAVRRKQPLAHLRSWATVGTPFMHFGPMPWWRMFSAPAFAVLLAVVTWLAAMLVVMIPFTYLIVRAEELVGNSPLLLILLPLAILLFIVVFPNIRAASHLIQARFAAVREARSARKEDRESRAAMRLYGARWLGIWSTADEAINGLKQTTNLHVQLLSDFAPFVDVPYLRPKSNQQRAIFEDMAKPSRFDIVLRVVNFGIRRFNRSVSGYLAAFLQGNNRPGTVVKTVTVSPLCETDALLPALLPSIDDALVAGANEAAVASLPKIRSVFGQAFFAGQGGISELNPHVREALSENLKELVHTSYFAHRDVQRLLCLHIAQHNGDDVELALDPDDPVYEWYRNFQESLRINVVNPLQLEASTS